MDNVSIKIFEKIKKSNKYQQEYWSARKLAKILNYSEYRNFKKVIKDAQQSCKNSDLSIKKHFVELNKMIIIGNTASREIKDTHLSRYACYLIMQNADPNKKIVALGQTYFAIQTRKQEIQNQYLEDKKRVFLREEVLIHNKHLSQTATKAGVKKHGIFTNYGYMGSEELAANLFRTTQTDAKLQRENVKGEAKANQTHFNIGKKVRQTIREINGTMPENLRAKDSINRAKTRLKKKLLK